MGIDFKRHFADLQWVWVDKCCFPLKLIQRLYSDCTAEDLNILLIKPRVYHGFSVESVSKRYTSHITLIVLLHIKGEPKLNLYNGITS